MKIFPSIALVFTLAAPMALSSPARAEGGDQSDAPSGGPSAYPLRREWYRLADALGDLARFHQRGAVEAARQERRVLFWSVMRNIRAASETLPKSSFAYARRSPRLVSDLKALYLGEHLQFHGEDAEGEFIALLDAAEQAASDMAALLGRDSRS